MNIAFIGTGSYSPEPGRDAASILINRRYLVDVGWNAALRMRENGFAPCDVRALFITHLHPDHYLGLAGLLLFLSFESLGTRNKKQLTIIGPANSEGRVCNMATVVERAELRLDLRLIPISPPEVYTDDDLVVDTFQLKHFTQLEHRREAVPTIGYRFTERTSKRSFCIAWDTAFCPSIARFAKNQSLLIHDVAHCTATQAARIGRMANVRRLYLIHYDRCRKGEILRKARAVFPRTYLAEDGKTMNI
jgi:ribonuclease Z